MHEDGQHAKRAVEKIDALIEGQQEDIDKAHDVLQNHQSQLQVHLATPRLRPRSRPDGSAC